MPFTSNAFLSGLLLLATMQMVPAPPLLALIPAVAVTAEGVATAAGVIGAASGVAGAVEGAIHHRRNTPLYSRVKRQQQLGNPEDWKNCYQQLGGHYINFASVGGNASDVLVSGLPSACITWAGDVTGKIGAGNPVIMANNAVKITGLSQSDLSEIQDAIDGASHIPK